MSDIESLYTKVDGKILIEIKLSSIMQLFNSFDPAPFHEKELDSDAEDYIIHTIKDFPAKTQFKIIIHLPPDLATTEKGRTLDQAVHNHFGYRMLVAERDFRQKFKFGRISLLIGLSFLAIALLARQIIPPHLSDQLLAQLFADALLIFGWAAMWEPITILLYELWPIVQMRNIYKNISVMEIEIIPSSQ